MTVCWRCSVYLNAANTVEMFGVLFCRECADLETGDDGRPDRVADQ